MVPILRVAFASRIGSIGATGVAALLLAALAFVRVGASGHAVMLPPPAVDLTIDRQPGEQVVLIAGGCFWGVQAVYQHTEGVIQAVSGYAGGSKQTATYDLVSSGATGHAEAVQVKFDPAKISYGRILQIFFSVVHDPTQLDRQGPDVGSQYRSAIFYSDADQKRVAEAYVQQLDALKVFPEPIVTRLERFDAFYPAEAYHQDYATRHPDQPYIAYHDLPKIESLKRLMPAVYRQAPVLVSDARNTQ
jgi:peptide-methionine (S)-S-oxide reductase